MQKRTRTLIKFVSLVQSSFFFFNRQEKLFDTMIEQRKDLEMFYINDTIQDQNRIIRHINDFLVVLANTLDEHIDRQVDFENTFDRLLLLLCLRSS